MSSPTCSAAGFRHEALFYADGVAGFERQIAPMVSETLAAGGSAAVAAPTDRVQRLHALFGPADRLTLIDMSVIGVNPARIIPAWRDLADAAVAAGAPFLGVGEPVWKGRTAPELDECHRHEALINVAFADDPAWRLVCPYDLDGLDAAVIDDARSTHPTVVDPVVGRAEVPVDGIEAFRALERPLDRVPGHAATRRFVLADLRDIRDHVRWHGELAGFSRERMADLVLAVTEMATNSIRHGGGAGTLDVWLDGDAVLCQTRDAGRIADPMVGRRRPTLDQPSGRGVWILHQICDLVQIRSSADGTTVRVTVR